ELKKLVLEGGARRGEKKGKLEKIDLTQPYLELLTSIVNVRPGLKIAIDYSNGAAALIFPKIAELLGIKVEGMNEIPDGSFPGHLPEPNEETLKPLQRFVVEVGADFGAGFDGDADRVVFVDDKGRLIPGDITLAVYVKFLEKKGKVIYDVSSSSALREVIREAGCEPVEMRVGRAFLLRAVRELGAVMGGEKSNHLYFPELHGFDDAVYAVLKMAEIVSKSGRKLSEIVDEIPKYPSTPILTFECPDELKKKVVEEIARRYESLGIRVSRIDGVKAYFDDGWVLIRPSNTMPQVKMTAEAKTEERLKQIVQEAENLIREKIESAKSS
ncbi:phosphomannomutase/phosphoglucomutase, partial [Candidatus Bathyarchaeota archaeon]